MTANNLRGTLCIWTDIDPEYEADFNRWYDTEHMQERVAIPGFQHARRFKCLDACERPYLALYCTDDIGVFNSPSYRQAFAEQTTWSLTNFQRMRNTQRRVGELRIECGEGEGGALSQWVLPAEKVNMSRLVSMLGQAVDSPRLTSATVLVTEPSLSVSLTAKGAALPPADALVMIEGSDPVATRQACTDIASAFGVADVYTFSMLWRLAAKTSIHKELL